MSQGQSHPMSQESLDEMSDEMSFEKIKILHQLKKPPAPYDWLSAHPEEGQTFEQYLAQNPLKPDQKRNTIYIVLLGDFDPVRRKIIELTAEFLRIYFQLPVKFADPIPLSVVPREAQRIHPLTGDQQILTSSVIEDLLAPRRPQDAFCLVAFTPLDLWPGEGWNFVFGQASLENRVGVWSIYRNGDPQGNPEDFKLCLLRTLKTGSHEIGHMFSMAHCIFYECNMNGSNHRRESDERPLGLCPVCLKKLHWAVGMDIGKRFQELADFCDRNGLTPEGNFYRKSLEVLSH
jgi:archaemetzincin